MRDTSLDAYLDLSCAGEIAERQRDLLRFLVNNSERDHSRRELARATGIELCSVTGRVRELLDRELIQECALRKCRISGRGVYPVRVCV